MHARSPLPSTAAAPHGATSLVPRHGGPDLAILVLSAVLGSGVMFVVACGFCGMLTWLMVALLHR
ncbi:MAG: hypothetical protein AB2A00_35005 [Myxococcota bacterium]